MTILRVVAFVILAGTLAAPAQISLSVRMVSDPTVTLTGPPGTYQIQWTKALGRDVNWTTLTNLTLPGMGTFCDTRVPSVGQRFYRAVQVPYQPNHERWAWINPGMFTLGSPATEPGRDGDEEPLTIVTLTNGFYLGRYEITQEEFQSVMGYNPALFIENPQGPVEQVTWYEAADYCVKLTWKEAAAGRLSAGWVYRLPTEAEWEYACRAGTTGKYVFGEDATGLTFYAWHGGNSGDQTHPVGAKQPNAWGLYDLTGNVSEWCRDWYGTYRGVNVDDWLQPTEGSTRVIRGGSWTDLADDCRSASRFSRIATDRSRTTGFRVVLAPDPPKLLRPNRAAVWLSEDEPQTGQSTICEKTPSLSEAQPRWAFALSGRWFSGSLGCDERAADIRCPDQTRPSVGDDAAPLVVHGVHRAREGQGTAGDRGSGRQAAGGTD